MGVMGVMGASAAPATTVAMISAMVTPALLILGSASLVASALLRMARVVDRARILCAAAHEGAPKPLGASRVELRSWLQRHSARARYIEWSVASLYAAVVIFVASCLSIALEQWSVALLPGLPFGLAFAGTLLLLAGDGWMVAESRMSGLQISEEIALALGHLKGEEQ